VLKDIVLLLTISIDQTLRALVIDFPCYGALEIVSDIIIIITAVSFIFLVVKIPGVKNNS